VSGISQAQLERAAAELGPFVGATLERVPRGGRFTTGQLLSALREDAEAEAAYGRALAILAESPGWQQAAVQVLHGQVVPQLLRACADVRFGGFAHDQPDDGTSVPVYWRRE
jgi:hypothetical protein